MADCAQQLIELQREVVRLKHRLAHMAAEKQDMRVMYETRLAHMALIAGLVHSGTESGEGSLSAGEFIPVAVDQAGTARPEETDGPDAAVRQPSEQ